MIKKLIRYFKGYVDFYAEGAESEKLINHCIKNGIEILNPAKENYKLYGKIFSGEYKKLRKPAKILGLKIRIIKKSGLLFFAKKNKRKIGFAVGIAFVIFFNIIMNCFIWEINVTGNENINNYKETVLNIANENGLLTGTRSKKHFVQDIEWDILRKIPDLSSVEINIQGSVANIAIKRTAKEEKMVPDDDIPINLIASRYGVIEKIDVFDGQGLVKPGDAVMKGDLLVSAVFEDRHNKLTLKHSRANIIAKTDYNITAEFHFDQTLETISGKSNNLYILEILGKEFYINKKSENYNLPNTRNKKKISFFNIELPITLTKISFFDVKQNNITYNLNYAKSGAYELLLKKEKEELENAKIISRKTDEKIKDGKYIITANYIVLMDIAEEQPIESDIPWENSDDMS